MTSTKRTHCRITSGHCSDRLWRKTASRLRGYLETRRLPYIIEREDDAIVLWLQGARVTQTNAQPRACT